MKYTILFLLNYLMATPSDSAFYNIVTSHRSRCYIAINVSITDSVTRVVIPSNKLFMYCAERKGFDSKQYKTFILSVLKQNSIIPIDSIDFVKYNFMKINNNGGVDQYFKMGITKFLKHYFFKVEGIKLWIAKNLTDEECADVINVLFYWQIPVAVDDETGFLVIARSD